MYNKLYLVIYVVSTALLLPVVNAVFSAAHE